MLNKEKLHSFLFLSTMILICLIIAPTQQVWATIEFRVLPSSSPILDNDNLDLVIVLDDTNGGDVQNINAVRFKVNSSLGTFAYPSMVDASQSWLGNSLTVTPTNLVATSPLVMPVLPTAPIEVFVGRDTPDNVSGTGEIVKLSCIMTVDIIMRLMEIEPSGDCIPFTIEITDIELIEALPDAGLEGAPIESITTLPDRTQMVYFCPKCQSADIQLRPICSATPEDGYTVDLSFSGNSSLTYIIEDDMGNPPVNAFPGSYNFGPYLNSSQVSFTITHPINGEACTAIVGQNCLDATPEESCTDGIQNQDETGIDCGGSCNPCLACDLIISGSSVCINSNAYQIQILVEGGGNYELTDNTGSPVQSGTEGLFIFGPYSSNSAVTVIVEDALDGATCSTQFRGSYSECTSCSFVPANNYCTGASFISIGSNGPFSNQCAIAASSNPDPGSCIFDEFTSAVWYSFQGTGGPLQIRATDCGGNLLDYENDLQLIIIDDCTTANELACSEDDELFQPVVTLNTSAGYAYYALFDGYGTIDPRGEFCVDVCSPPSCSVISNSGVTCPTAADATLQVEGQGGTGSYTYRWSTGDTGSIVTNMGMGNYIVTITDSNGCICRNEIAVGLGVNALSSVSMPTTQGSAGGVTPFYFNGNTVEITGGTAPYSYEWDNSGYVRFAVVGTGEVRIIYADNATWSLTVTDSFGCEVSESNNSMTNTFLDIHAYNVTQTSGSGQSNGAISINVSGGTPPYSFNWSNGGFSNIVMGLIEGWYTVTVTDSSIPNQTTQGWYWVPDGVSGRGGKAISQNPLLAQIHPNPSNSFTNISWVASDNGHCQIQLVDLSGRALNTVQLENAVKGDMYQQQLDLRDYPTGMYFCKIISGSKTSALKLMIEH